MTYDEIIHYCKTGLLNQIIHQYNLEEYQLTQVQGHDGGRNVVYIAKKEKEDYVVRISSIENKRLEAYLAETEFVHYLAQKGASVADVICSKEGKLVEEMKMEQQDFYISVFKFAKGDLISDHNYKYIDHAPLSEYFYNTGRTIGKIHELSKRYQSDRKYLDYFEHYNMGYLNELIPDEYQMLKDAIEQRLIKFSELQKSQSTYGLVHFDFSDGNYHIDYSNGNITVFDFENCCTCWYMFDLANLWTHGVGWIAWESDAKKRKSYMEDYFNFILQGYRSETEISEEMLAKLPLFIDMVLIESIVDQFECCARDGEELDYEDIEEDAEALINNVEYAGFLS